MTGSYETWCITHNVNLTSLYPLPLASFPPNIWLFLPLHSGSLWSFQILPCTAYSDSCHPFHFWSWHASVVPVNFRSGPNLEEASCGEKNNTWGFTWDRLLSLNGVTENLSNAMLINCNSLFDVSSCSSHAVMGTTTSELPLIINPKAGLIMHAQTRQKLGEEEEKWNI